MKSKTVDYQRHFTCKSCGRQTVEDIRKWKKKPQKDKNVCIRCLDRRHIAEVTRQERLEDAAFYGRYSWPF